MENGKTLYEIWDSIEKERNDRLEREKKEFNKIQEQVDYLNRKYRMRLKASLLAGSRIIDGSFILLEDGSILTNEAGEPLSLE